MKKFSEWAMALLFSGTLLVLMAATILLPKERYSYYENRNLSAFPEISVESVASGKVFGELETMFCDYAAWRTAALRAVTWCDLNLFHRPVVNEVVVTPDALNARKIRSLYFPAAGVLVTVGEGEGKRINMKRFIDPEKERETRRLNRLFRKGSRLLLDDAAEAFASARTLHFELEDIYVAAMDFEKAGRLRDALINEIF